MASQMIPFRHCTCFYLRASDMLGLMFGVLGSRCLRDCHVLKGFGIYMIGILDCPY